MNLFLAAVAACLTVTLTLSFRARNKAALQATNAWCDAGNVVTKYLLANPRKERVTDLRLQVLLCREAEAYKKFLETHPYCDGPFAQKHLKWYYEGWRRAVLMPTPKLI